MLETIAELKGTSDGRNSVLNEAQLGKNSSMEQLSKSPLGRTLQDSLQEMKYELQDYVD